MSDPTPPTNGDEPLENIPPGQASELDSGPIDVNELLESTRKLFEPEELQRSMELAGYTPEPSGVREPDTSNHVDDESGTTSVVKRVGDDSPGGSDDIPSDSPADGEWADEWEGDDTSHEDSSPKGINVLSIVAFVLALALSPLAVIFGYIALGQTRRARQRGETLALWAIGLGWVVFAAWAVLISSLVWIGYQQGTTLDSLRDFIELFSLP